MVMRVNMKAGPDGTHRPDLPEWAGYTITEWHEDDTVTVELDERTQMRMLIEAMQAERPPTGGLLINA